MKRLLLILIVIVCGCEDKKETELNKEQEQRKKKEENKTKEENNTTYTDIILELDAEKLALLSIIKKIPNYTLHLVLKDY